MAIKLGDLYYALHADRSQLDRDIDSAQKQVSSSTFSLGRAMNVAVGNLVSGGIGLALNGFKNIASGIGGLAKDMITSNAAFEDYNTRFKVLLGSTEAAQKRMKDLADFGAKTPFDLPGVVEADLILQSFGLHSEEAAKKFGFAGDEIRTIAGDVASGTGRNFDEIALLIGKFSSGATGEAIARMQELGIATREQLTEMGLEFSKSGELLSPLPQAMNTVLQLMQEKYGGLMAEQSGTLNGMASNLRDWIGNAIRTVGQPIFEPLKQQLGGLLDLLNSEMAQQGLQFLANGVGTVAKTVATFMTYAGPMFMGFLMQLQDMGPGLGLVLGDAFDRIGKALLDIGVTLGIADENATGMTTALSILQGILNAIVTSIQVFAIGMQGAAWAIEQVAKALQIAKDLWAQFVTIVEKGAGLELPDWLKPGSPPPIANALNDTADALQRMQQMRGGNLGGGAFGNVAAQAGQSAGGAAPAAVGGGSIMQTIQLVVDGRILAEVVNSGLGQEMKNTNALTA